MKKFSSFLILSVMCLGLNAQQITTPEPTEVWDPEPRIVETKFGDPPSDAIVLLDGTNMDEWQHVKDDRACEWTLDKKIMTVNPGQGDIKTKRSFGDCQLHLEWRTPTEIEGEGQGRGNSGVFFQGRYEVQILDSYENRTYANGQASSIYKQHPPLVNSTRAPGEWQEYDIIFMAPRFNADGVKVRSGSLTVFLNGVLVQNHVEIKGTTEYIGLPKNDAHGDGPIILQDHSNPVSYYNIWIREL